MTAQMNLPTRSAESLLSVERTLTTWSRNPSNCVAHPNVNQFTLFLSIIVACLTVSMSTTAALTPGPLAATVD